MVSLAVSQAGKTEPYVMVFVTVLQGGKTEQYYIDKGVKVNGEYYRITLLKACLLPDISLSLISSFIKIQHYHIVQNQLWSFFTRMFQIVLNHQPGRQTVRT